jgi:hypothetical protein
VVLLQYVDYFSYSTFSSLGEKISMKTGFFHSAESSTDLRGCFEDFFDRSVTLTVVGIGDNVHILCFPPECSSLWCWLYNEGIILWWAGDNWSWTSWHTSSVAVHCM